MPLASMTGYARLGADAPGVAFVWEARSVNGKGLDVRPRLPAGWERLDPPVREAASARFKRGSITLALQIAPAADGPVYRVNEGLLDRLADLCAARGQDPDYGALMAVRGVVEPAEAAGLDPDDEAVSGPVLAALGDALDQLAEMRQSEGARIAASLHDRLGEIEALVEEAEGLAAARPEAIRARLMDQVAGLADAAAGLDPDRLAQEVALLAAKADIREELDRLAAHIAAARALMGEDGAVGRKLDFLCQEFNREANTLCAKSNDTALTRVGLALKAAIDQLREQVQNVE